MWVYAPLHPCLSSCTGKYGARQYNAGLTSNMFCWLGSNMKWKVSFHFGLMLLSMCLVFFLLSGAVGTNSSTYGSGVSTAHTHSTVLLNSRSPPPTCTCTPTHACGCYVHATCSITCNGMFWMLASHKRRQNTDKTHTGHPALPWWHSQLEPLSQWICEKTAVPPEIQHSFRSVCIHRSNPENHHSSKGM